MIFSRGRYDLSRERKNRALIAVQKGGDGVRHRRQLLDRNKRGRNCLPRRKRGGRLMVRKRNGKKMKVAQRTVKRFANTESGERRVWAQRVGHNQRETHGKKIRNFRLWEPLGEERNGGRTKSSFYNEGKSGRGSQNFETIVVGGNKKWERSRRKSRRVNGKN